MKPLFSPSCSARGMAARCGLLLAALCISPPAWTQPPWLPPDDAVRQALATHPAMDDAKAQLDASGANAEASRLGHQETSLRVVPQGRWVRDPADRYPELQIAVERPLRLGGKAQADGAIADAAQASASIAWKDAMHELSRDLLARWFAALSQRAENDALREAWRQSETLAATVAARVRHGDAAQLDMLLADADLQRARAASLGAEAALRAAQAELATQFPGLGEPAAMPAIPPPPAQNAEELRRRYVSGSHAVLLAQAEASRMQSVAKRVDLERHGDPVVGAFAASERGGSENIVGISVSIPLGSGYRDAQARAASAEAVAAWARSLQAERMADAEFRSLWESLQGARSVAEALARAAAQQDAAAAKTSKAYALGEAGITEVLAARRGAADADLQARRVLIEAARLQARLELDLHDMWDFDE